MSGNLISDGIKKATVFYNQYFNSVFTTDQFAIFACFMISIIEELIHTVYSGELRYLKS